MAWKSSLKVLILTVVCTPLLLSVFPLGQIFDGFSAASVKGQRVLICGASSGIGEQMAYEYAKMGAHLALIARREALLEKVMLATTAVCQPNSRVAGASQLDTPITPRCAGRGSST